MIQDIHKIIKGKQLSVFLDDKPGMLASISLLLGRHGISIYALSLAEGIGHGYVRMVVSKHEEARQILQDAGELVMEREVLVLELSNQPGSLGRAAQALSDAQVNVEYAYCAAGPQVDHGMVIIKVDDTEKGLALLQGA